MSLKELDIVHVVSELGHVVKVGNIGFAVLSGDRVDYENSSICSFAIDFGTLGFHVMLWVLAMQHKMAASVRNRVFDQTAREFKATILVTSPTSVTAWMQLGIGEPVPMVLRISSVAS